MKVKVVATILLGLCLNFFIVFTAFAQTSEQILQKQKEIDTYIFEEHAEELAGKGISVTHTAPMEDKVEIGILPYNEETISYFHGIFGEENLSIVDGQMAVTMVTTDDPAPLTPDEVTVQDKEEGKSGSSLTNPIMISTVGIVLLVGVIFVIQKKRRV